MVANGNGTNGARSWQTISAIIVSAVAVVGIIYQVASVSFTASSNAVSLDDLKKLVSRIDERETALTNRASIIETSLQEIETQFCGADNMRNLMHATDLRVFSMLWEKTFPGSRYPTDNAFYPTVCNRSPPRH